MSTQHKAAVERKRGMDDVQREAITAHFNKQDDLYTTCQKCEQQVRGTLAQIQAHTCGD